MYAQGVEENEQAVKEPCEAELVAAQQIRDLQEKILQIERGWWKIAPSRAEAISRTLGFTQERYYLLLGEFLDLPEFWQLDPPLVGRLKALRDDRLDERKRLD